MGDNANTALFARHCFRDILMAMYPMWRDCPANSAAYASFMSSEKYSSPIFVPVVTILIESQGKECLLQSSRNSAMYFPMVTPLVSSDKVLYSPHITKLSQNILENFAKPCLLSLREQDGLPKSAKLPVYFLKTSLIMDSFDLVMVEVCLGKFLKTTQANHGSLGSIHHILTSCLICKKSVF